MTRLKTKKLYPERITDLDKLTVYWKLHFPINSALSGMDFHQLLPKNVFGYFHGVLHYHEGDSFFQKDKSCITPKIRLKLILIFYKDQLEVLKLLIMFEKIEFEQHVVLLTSVICVLLHFVKKWLRI